MRKYVQASPSDSKPTSIRYNYKEMFSSSARNLLSLQCLVTTAMLIALRVCLELVGSIQVSDFLRISTSFLALGMIGLLYGPVVGTLGGFLADILTFAINPRGAYFPGYTVAYMVAGLIFGLVLYHKRAYPSQEGQSQPPKSWFHSVLLNKNGTGFLRTFTAKGLYSLIVNMILITTCLILTKGFTATIVEVPVRLLKNVILLIPESIILYIIIRIVETQPRLFPARKE
ncbi:MAG: folate family ECF transporter S component [Christensenellales bacterium]